MRECSISMILEQRKGLDEKNVRYYETMGLCVVFPLKSEPHIID
jgi:hypothetical protein